MTVKISRRSPVALSTGDLWLLSIEVRDIHDRRVDDPPTVTITKPDGTTAAATVTAERTGCYSATYVVAVAGRYLARAASASNGLADVATWAGAPVPAS